MACVKKRRGRYVLDFYDQYGKRQRITTEKGTTKKQANDDLRAILDAVDDGVYMPTRKMPLFSEVAEEWLKHKKGNLRITSWEVCEGHTKNHFSEIDSLKIGRITTAAIEKWIQNRREEGMTLGTLRKVLVTLGQIMGYAVRHKYVDHNPVRDAERPRDTGNEVKGEVFRILSPAEIRGLLDAADSEKYRTLFMMAIFTGARQGELLGLQWGDIEWESKQVYIQRTYTKGQFFDTKTRTSRRKIDLAPAMLQQLRKWKLACPKFRSWAQGGGTLPEQVKTQEEVASHFHKSREQILKWAGKGMPQMEDGRYDLREIEAWATREGLIKYLDLVFPNEAGQPMNYSNMMNRHYLPALRKAGVLPELEKAKKGEKKSKGETGKKEKEKSETIRFHDLRHTFASLLIEQGENLKYIQTQLGHSSPTVTLNVYAHLMKPTNQAAAERLEKAIFQSTGHNLVTIQEKGATA